MTVRYLTSIELKLNSPSQVAENETEVVSAGEGVRVTC
jgi:hypothetical protein